MKRIISLILITIPTFAALPVGSTWEVRPTVGTNTNGGGFVLGASGTDMSQFNNKNAAACSSCQSATINISTTDAVANGTTTVTSATGNFSAAIVGNILNFSGGTGSLASGWYQVVTFTNSTTIVLDRAIAAGTGITMNIGGALSTIAQAVTNKVQGNTIYVKATGAYTVTTTQNLVAGDGGTGDTATTFIGYTSTRTDNGQVTWTTATDSVDLITFAVANNFAFYNFAFTNTAGTKGNGITAGTSGANGNLQLYNCGFDGFNIAVNGPFVGSFSWEPLLMVNGVVKNSVSHGILNGYNLVLRGSFIHDNGGMGVKFDNTGDNQQSATISHNIFYNNVSDGVGTDGGTSGTNQFVDISNNAFVANGGNGVNLNGQGASGFYYTNNIFDSNGAFGVNTNAAMHVFMLNNAFRANASGKYPTNVKTTSAIGEVPALTGSPFVSVGTNFALNSTAGAGAACKGAGFPGVLQAGGTGSIDIGPLQSAAGASATQSGYVSQ